MTNVLFTGGTGLLGKYFFASTPTGFKSIGTFNTNQSKRKDFYGLDITRKHEVFLLFTKLKPDIVVHAASIGSVDYCEAHKDEAKTINVNGTRNVLEATQEIGARLIFTSSNAVFNGKSSSYHEESDTDPLDYYGKTKVEGERIIQASDNPYVIVRLMTMYGWPPKGGRGNPVSWVIEELRKKRKINVVSDIYNNHLYAGHAASILWKIIKKNKKNQIYNIAGKDCVSRFELANAVADVFDLDKSYINPVESDFFKKIAPRPKNTCFDTSRMQTDLGIRPFSITLGLKKMRDEK